MISDMIGWILWSVMAIAGSVLIYGAIVDSINDWRWRRAWKRGEIKPQTFQEKLKAEYLAAPRVP